MERTEFEALKERFLPEEGATLIRAELTAEELGSLTTEEAEELTETFGATTLVRLPAKEIEFFDWL